MPSFASASRKTGQGHQEDRRQEQVAPPRNDKGSDSVVAALVFWILPNRCPVTPAPAACSCSYYLLLLLLPAPAAYSCRLLLPPFTYGAFVPSIEGLMSPTN